MEQSYILLKVFVPEEYLEVNPEIIRDDFMENPKAWEIELVEPVLMTALAE